MRWTVGTVGVVGLAVLVGYRVADAGNSDGMLGIQEVLRGCAVAGVILIAGLLAAKHFGVGMDPAARSSLASFLAWAALFPAILWTLLLAFALAVSSGGHEPLSLEETLPDWAIFAVPMFLASALLFALAHSRPRSEFCSSSEAL